MDLNDFFNDAFRYELWKYLKQNGPPLFVYYATLPCKIRVFNCTTLRHY